VSQTEHCEALEFSLCSLYAPRFEEHLPMQFVETAPHEFRQLAMNLAVAGK
jgi:hypothetical protein